MPKRKKLPSVPDYEGLAQNYDDMLVQKANPLQSLAETDLTLPELKILDAYLARINSHKPDERYVRFEKGELEKLLGVVKIPKQELERRLKNLFTAVKIVDDSKRKGFSLIALFVKADCEQDEAGQWQVDLACSAEAMEYIFNVENLGYLKYRLKNVIALTSRYSYILFLYFLNNRFRKSWNISLIQLKTLLRCTAERYEQYKFFNSEILKKCQKELTEKTDIKYTYEPIKKGRKIIAIRFTLETLPKIELEDTNESQMTLEQWQAQAETNKEKELWESAIDEFSFTSKQIAELREVLICIPEYKMPQSIACYDAIELRRYHYMKIKAVEIKRRTNIKNTFAYLLKMLKQDADIDI